MTKLSKRLPDDNEKLQPLVGEIRWSKNLIPYCDLPKVQPLVAQIDWSHNPIILQHCHAPLEGELEDLNSEAMRVATIGKKNIEELGV